MALNPFDTNELLFKVLNESGIKEELQLKGNIFIQNTRSDNEINEDIVINALTFDRNYPQNGISNINIYCPDILVKIGKQTQKKPNFERLKEISNKVLEILDNQVIQGLKFNADSVTIIKDFSNFQYYCNIRLNWIIGVKKIDLNNLN